MKSNTRFNQNNRGIECLNCHQPISTTDNFCSNCGQVNDLKPLSIKQYISEFFSGFFAFDTRTLNTIIPLIFKPGKVTKEYIHGERMKYVNPFQLYLHTSIIFFLVTGVFMTIDKYDSITKKDVKVAENFNKKEVLKNLDSIKNSVSDELEKANVKANKNFFNLNIDVNNFEDAVPKIDSLKIKKSSKKIKSIISNKEVKKRISNHINKLLDKSVFLSIIKDTLISSYDKESVLDTFLTKKISKEYRSLKKKFRFENDSLNKFIQFKKFYFNKLQSQLALRNVNYTIGDYIKMTNENKLFSSYVGRSLFMKFRKFKNSKTKDVAKALDSLHYPKTRRNIFLFNKAQDVNRFKNESEFRQNYLNNMISKTSIVLFFMLPIFTLFLSLIYIRKKINYTEHLIFIFHLQTVFFMLLLISMSVNRILKTDFMIVFFVIFFMIYLFVAMKRFYKQRFFKTMFKYILLNMVYIFLSILGTFVVAFLAFVM